MPIQTRTEGSATVVAISGRLVLGREVDGMETAVKGAIHAGQSCIVLDLAGLDYIDSSGVGCVVACLTAAKKAGGDLRLAGTTPRVERIFKMTGVNSLLTMYPTVAAATAGA